MTAPEHAADRTRLMLLMGGRIIIALHQHWRGAAAVIVSLFGWFLAIRGVLLLTVPGAYDSAADTLTGPATYTAVLGVFVIVALAGLYLTYAGWIAAPAVAPVEWSAK